MNRIPPHPIETNLYNIPMSHPQEYEPRVPEETFVEHDPYFEQPEYYQDPETGLFYYPRRETPSQEQSLVPPKLPKVTPQFPIIPVKEKAIELQKPRRRYCCGCFKTRRSCCSFWAAFFILLLIGLGVAAYFLWPRYPTVLVSDPFVPPGDPGLSVSRGEPTVANVLQNIQTSSPSNPFSFYFNVQVNIFVYSPNYLTITIDQILYNSTLMSGKAMIPSFIGVGNITNAVIKSFENSTLTLPVTLAYTATSPTVLTTDPAIALIADACTNKTPIQMTYKATFVLKIIEWTGYRPSYESNVNVNCPASVAAILSGLKAGTA